ncbi:MAG: FMN-binding glutamate synthase family protein, partial [Solirubrobacterales bacterium]|nr:FMN-binding glutamate synthase family protein [Solirubrobacterales bacterium]
IRGVPAGRDCVSPSSHSAFDDVDGLIEFVELLGAETRLPVGIKSAVGDAAFWERLAERMAATGGGPDSITVDGAEGGTGAAPLVFSDHVSLPFKIGFSRVYATFARAGLAEDVVFIGSGRLGFPDAAMFAFALGADMVSVGREAMLSIGCIQAQRCHTGRCPTGVATQSRWLMHGLDPELKSSRAANYLTALRAELLSLSRACGVRHPALVRPERLEIVTERYGTARLRDVFGYEDDWPLLSPARRAEVEALVGTGGGRRAPGPEAGPIPGDEAGTRAPDEPTEPHHDTAGTAR